MNAPVLGRVQGGRGEESEFEGGDEDGAGSRQRGKTSGQRASQCAGSLYSLSAFLPIKGALSMV